MRCWGIYDANRDRKNARLALQSLLSQAMACQGIALEGLEWKGHPVHWFDPRPALAMPRLMLIGDAAGVDRCSAKGSAWP